MGRLIRMEGETLIPKREVERFPKCEYNTVDTLLYAASKLKYEELRELRHMLFEVFTEKKKKFEKEHMAEIQVGDSVRYKGESVNRRPPFQRIKLHSNDVGIVLEKKVCKVRVKFNNDTNNIWRIGIGLLERVIR